MGAGTGTNRRGPSRRATEQTRERRTAEQTREHILCVAEVLFYSDGVRSTGIDRLAARAEVAPTTLYRLFASKDDLVAAYVERCSERYKGALRQATAPDTRPARERILAVFDTFAQDIASAGCRGCAFLMVLAEYPDPLSPAHASAVGHKDWLRGLFQTLVGDLAATSPVPKPEALVNQLALVAEGMYASVQALGPTGPAAHGRATAEVLLDAAQRPTGRLP